MKKSLIWMFLVSFFILIFTCSLCNASESSATESGFPLVRKDERTKIFTSENGEISAVTIRDGTRGQYYLQFISLAPNSLFLPVLLHADMVFFVQTGSGRLTTVFDDNVAELNLERGDLFRLYPGTVFYVQSKLDDKLTELRIDAIFSSTDENFFESSIGAYSSISDLVLGFDDRVLESAFKIPEDLVKYLRNVTRPQGIVPALPQQKETFWELESRLIKAFLGISDGNFNSLNSKKKKKKTKTKESKAYNIFQESPDFQNCNGWSIAVDRNDLKQLRGSNIGFFMVNLTKGSMLGPHWNMMATEISVVLQGQGVISVVCSGSPKESDCKTRRLWVKEGDVFVVPRFHPMAQMSFNNNSFVFIGFSTSSRINFPQFLAGERSVFNTLNRSIIATSLNLNTTTVDQLVTRQKNSVILECTSCAEEEARIIQQEIEKAKQEEARKKREEEEAARRERERKEEEEEAARREEQRKKREEEEAARKKREEEEEARRERERKEEEEEAARREEERKKREKHEEEQRQQEEERKKEEAAAKAEEEARKAREEEEAREHGEGPGGPPGGPSEKQQQEEQRKQEEAAASEQEKARKQKEGQGGQPEGPGGQGGQKQQRQQEEAAASEQEKARKHREEQGGQPLGPGQQKQGREQEEAAASEQEKAKKQKESQWEQPQVPGEQGGQKQQRQQEEAAAREQETARKHREGQGGQPQSPGGAKGKTRSGT